MKRNVRSPTSKKTSIGKTCKDLTMQGYAPADTTPGLLKHKTKPVHFTLVVNNFGVKYIIVDNAKHLIKCIEDFTKSQ